MVCAITSDGRSTETKIIEKLNTVLIGKSAVGKAALSGFKNSITNPESQKATQLFIKRLLDMIERLDEGVSIQGAKFVLDFSLFSFIFYLFVYLLYE